MLKINFNFKIYKVWHHVNKENTPSSLPLIISTSIITFKIIEGPNKKHFNIKKCSGFLEEISPFLASNTLKRKKLNINPTNVLN